MGHYHRHSLASQWVFCSMIQVPYSSSVTSIFEKFTNMAHEHAFIQKLIQLCLKGVHPYIIYTDLLRDATTAEIESISNHLDALSILRIHGSNIIIGGVNEYKIDYSNHRSISDSSTLALSLYIYWDDMKKKYQYQFSM